MGKLQRIGDRHNEDVEDADDLDHRSGEDDEVEDDDESSEGGEQPARSSRDAAKYRKRAKEYRRQLKAVQAEIDQLKSEPKEDGLRLLRAELAFTKAAVAKGIDPDAAWKLADQPAIVASWNDDDQTFAAIGDSLEQVVERYPYVAKDDGKAKDDKEGRVTFPPPASTSGKPTNKRRQAGHKLDRAYLEAKYPALRGRSRA